MILYSHFISSKINGWICDTDNCNNGLLPKNCTIETIPENKTDIEVNLGNKTDIEANLYTTTENPTSEKPSRGNLIVMAKSLTGLIVITNLVIVYFSYH